MAEHRKMFEKAASEQWFPVAEIMAKVIKRVESHSTDIPASEIVNIDLEFGPYSKVLQIGLADLEGARVIDCLTRYSEGVIAPSSSRLLVQASYQLKRFEKKVRALPSRHGTLDANRVVGKLREIGISKKTIFLTWEIYDEEFSHLGGANPTPWNPDDGDGRTGKAKGGRANIKTFANYRFHHFDVRDTSN
jgi:hypothetical protein